MTVHQTAKLIREHYFNRLSIGEKSFVEKMLDGLDGLGEVSDVTAREYLSEKQIRYIKTLGKKFRI